MIAVIADDFTGAAELAAVGLRYGLDAEVQTIVNPNSKADLVVIDTNTRSRTPKEAAAEVQRAAKQLQKIPVEWIYKKVDSVLRGHVLPELHALPAALNMQRVLLVPANPSRARTISNGHYFINGQPLSETDFSRDPEYPAASSDVLALLGLSQSITTCVLQHQQPIPPQAIAVGEAQSKDDLLAWAARLDAQTVPAGAAEFFAAILETKGFRLISPEDQDESLQCATVLFICGSSSYYSRKAVEEARSRGVPVSKMPPNLLQTDNQTDKLLQQWTNDIISAFNQHPQVIVAINQPISQNPALADKLRHHTGALVENVLNRLSIGELCIEGGATASAVVRWLRWKRFFPCRELAPGIVRMRVQEKPDLCLTIKPGSYPWPEKIWPLTS